MPEKQKRRMMVTEEVLHEDSDGKKVILHIDLDDTGVEIGRWVTYERYPDVKYVYLTALDVAEIILKGGEIIQSYIQELTVDTLKNIEEKLKTGQFISVGESEINHSNLTGPILEKPIICRACLIGTIDFHKLKIINLDFTAGSWDSGLHETHVFGESQFMDSHFRGEANFEGVSFHDNVEFSSVTFTGRADFRAVTFSGYAFFWDTTFKGDAVIVDATFKGEAYFGQAIFSCGAYFGATIFLHDSVFNEATFNLEADFEGSVFNGYSNFEDAIFHGNVNFSEAYIVECNFSKVRFKRTLNMSKIAIGSINFSKAIIVENLYLTRDLNQIEPRNCCINFEDTLVQSELKIDFGNLCPLETFPVIEPHRDNDWDEARKQYSWLKEQYRKQGAYEDEDKAHWWAMDCRMKSRPLLGWFYRNVLGYGVRPLNVLLTIGFVLLFFWGIFIIANFTDHILANQSANNQLSVFERIYDSLYFSVITFATVGYGDIQPVGWAKGFAMLEGLLGIVLNAALVVVMFRKLIR